jgi:hypothetical protein
MKVTTLKDEIPLPALVSSSKMPVERIAIYAALVALVLFILLALWYS